MALTADDYLYPRWRLKAEVFWPGKSAAACEKAAKAALNGGLIERAYATVTDDGIASEDADDASRLQVGVLAADGRLQQMGGLPAQQEIRNQGSSAYTQGQLEWMIAFKAEMLAAYEELIPVEEAEANTVAMPGTSRSVRACIDPV